MSRHPRTSLSGIHQELDSRQKFTRRWRASSGMTKWVVVSVLSLIFLGLLICTSKSKSLVYDEVIYAPAGFLYWETGDLSWNKTHPPLQKYISGLPLYLKNISHPTSLDSKKTSEWHMGYEIFFHKDNNSLNLIQWARAPSIFLSLLLGLFVFFWGLKWAGWEAGTLAMALLVFDPLILGNGSLAMNDIFVTFFFCLSIYLFLRSLKGSLVSAIGCAASAALCVVSKFSGLLLLPTFLILLLANRKSWQALPRKKLAVFAGGGILIFAGIILSLYKFDGSLLFDALNQGRGLQEEAGRKGFLHGSIPGGWTWLYYPVALLIKTPIPLLALWGASLFFLYRKKQMRNHIALLAPVSLVLFAALVTPNHFGVRYLLPAIPLMALLVGVVFSKLTLKGKKVFLLLVGWMILEVGITHPHHMSYFNEFIGGSRNGAKWLDGSNQDWGQDIPGLKKVMDYEGDVSLFLAYQGSNDPGAWGIQYQDVFSPAITSRYTPLLIHPIKTKKEWLAISAGILFHPEYSGFFSWLDPTKAKHRVGNTFYVFDITQDVDVVNELGRFYLLTGRRALAERQKERSWYVFPRTPEGLRLRRELKN